MTASDPRYRFMVLGETGVGSQLRSGLAALLSATLDDGERYRPCAWRTLRPAFRVVALDPDGQPVGQGSCFWVPCRPRSPLLGLGDVAVAPDHRRRQVARTVCTLATHEGWRLHASAILARTKPLRSVLPGRFVGFRMQSREGSGRTGVRARSRRWPADPAVI